MTTRSLQDIFDDVYTHLIRQGKKSFFPGQADFIDEEYRMCAYRGTDGLMCALGVLIPDDKYDAEFEGSSSLHLLDHQAIPEILESDHKDRSSRIYDELQTIHDLRDVNEWPVLLREFANRYGLTVPVLV